MKETLQILFSTRLTPDEISSLITGEKNIFLRMYNDKSYINEPTKPHGYIKNIMFDVDEGYMGFIVIPEIYDDVFKTYNDPVIHPTIYGTDGIYKISHFSLYEKNVLIMKNVYKGIK